MRGTKFKGILTILLSLFLLFNFPITSIGQVDQEDEVSSEVKLYLDLGPTEKMDHGLSPKPLNENKFLTHCSDLYFKTSSPGEKYDLIIDGNENVLIELWLTVSYITFVPIEVILSDNNETELASGLATHSVASGVFKIQMNLDLSGEEIKIIENHELYLNIIFGPFPGAFMPINITVHSGPDYPSGLTLTIKNPLKVELQITDDTEGNKLSIYALHTTPFGGENIERLLLEIRGPTYQDDLSIAMASYPASTGSQRWIWSYGENDPKPGTYTIHLNTTTRQGVEGQDTYVFELEDDTEDEEFFNMIMFVIFLIFIIMIICIGLLLYFKHRKKIKKKIEKG